MSTHHDVSARLLLRHLVRLLHHDGDTVPAQVPGLRFAVSTLATTALLDAAEHGDADAVSRAERTLRVLDGLPTDKQWRQQRLEQDQAVVDPYADDEARARWEAAVRAYDERLEPDAGL